MKMIPNDLTVDDLLTLIAAVPPDQRTATEIAEEVITMLEERGAGEHTIPVAAYVDIVEVRKLVRKAFTGRARVVASYDDEQDCYQIVATIAEVE
jgi:hypothetical protein